MCKHYLKNAGIIKKKFELPNSWCIIQSEGFMYVCICNNITEDQVKTVVSKGLSGKDALSHLGVGTGCGICVMDAIDRLTKNSEPKVQNTTQSSNK